MFYGSDFRKPRQLNANIKFDDFGQLVYIKRNLWIYCYTL